MIACATPYGAQRGFRLWMGKVLWVILHVEISILGLESRMWDWGVVGLRAWMCRCPSRALRAEQVEHRVVQCAYRVQSMYARNMYV